MKIKVDLPNKFFSGIFRTFSFFFQPMKKIIEYFVCYLKGMNTKVYFQKVS